MRTRPHHPLSDSGHLVLLVLALSATAATVGLLSVRWTTGPPAEATPEADDVEDAGAGSRAVPNRLLVKFEERTPNAVVASALERAGSVREGSIQHTRVLVVHVPPARREKALRVLESFPFVEYAERDVRLRALDTIPNDAEWPAQWGPRRVAAPRAWDAARGSASVVVAVLDTGVDFAHADLAGAFVAGYDFVNDDPEADDDHGHGTATAGVVAARTDNREGIAGVCWACSIMPVKVLGSDARGDSATVARGIVWAADHGASVINLSLGGPETTRTVDEAVAYAIDRGVSVVAAAGNDGTSTPYYPAASVGVIGVAAVDESGVRYGWSNHGSWVRVAAPGCNLAPLPGGGYGHYCGTSSAAPVIAGLVGLARSFAPGATRSEVEAALERGAEPFPTGFARVDAARMLSGLGAFSARPAPVSSLRVRGQLSALASGWERSLAVDAGTIVASLSFAPSSRLRLSLVDSTGRTISRAAGGSPLRTAKQVLRGTYRFVVTGRGRRGTGFVLRVSYPRAS